MRMGEWECISCCRKFDKPWLGPAFVMATECVYCGKVAVGNEEGTWDDEVLKVEDEKEEA